MVSVFENREKSGEDWFYIVYEGFILLKWNLRCWIEILFIGYVVIV